MLFPIQHENMSARRWPVITIGLIVINILVFLVTMGSMEKEGGQAAELKGHILMLAAAHPELTVKPETQEIIDALKIQHPQLWEELKSPFRKLEDSWDVRMRMMDEPGILQGEMDRLEGEYAKFKKESLTESYAFVPAHPTTISYLTANFLHGGWIHLIGNMWFLWLAGFVLEDTWGRPMYLIFYLVAGVAALQFHAWMNPLSTIPTLGASGAVAGLMGAFLVRFPKMKIEMGWLWITMLRGVRFFRFSVPAWALLPFWVILEATYGRVLGTSSGTAHWAHVGGFVFGAVFSLGVKYSGIEKKLMGKIVEQTEWQTDTEIQEATELLHSGKPAEALPIMQAYVAKHPDSEDGLNLLRELFKRNNRNAEYQDVLIQLCAIHVSKRELVLAEQDVTELVRSGRKLPAPDWLALAAAHDLAGDSERALYEYENVSQTYKGTRDAVLAQTRAGKICAQKLNRPKDAVKYYTAAAASTVPHADLEVEIQVGLAAANKALGKAPAAVPKPVAAPPKPAAVAGVPSKLPSWESTDGYDLGNPVVPTWAAASSVLEIDPPREPSATEGPELASEMVASWENAAPAYVPPPPVVEEQEAHVSAAPQPAEQNLPAFAMASASSQSAGAAALKPQTWGKFEAPPVWGHGAKGDTIHKPEVSEPVEKKG
jgi:membrane associated rhomboid family serine protease